MTVEERLRSAACFLGIVQRSGTKILNIVTFIDVEASGLHRPDSYPIEIGWADTLGNGDSFLIIPESDWTHWDPAAERVHGIPRERLFDEGITAVEATERLRQGFGLETVYCDAAEFDGFWLGRLFSAASAEPAFLLADTHELYNVIGADNAATLAGTLASLPVRHRARADAERWVSAFTAALG